MIIIKNGYVVTFDANRRVIENGSVVIDEDRIVDVGKTEELRARYDRAEYVIDATNRIVMPGLINCHNHLFQTLLRGLGCDLPLATWLEKIVWPYSRKLKGKALRAGALLSTLEMVKTGTTCVADSMYINVDSSNFDTNAQAVVESGLRAVLQRSCVDTELVPMEFRETPETALSRADKAFRDWNGKANGRIKVALEPLNEALASPEMIKGVRALSSKLGARFHMHCAEARARTEAMKKKYGMGTVEYLRHIGALDSRTLLAHCVWVTDKEQHILKDTGTSVVHNPVSNQYLADGIAPVKGLMEKGVNVCLGTDGAASNNCQDMFQAVKAAVLLQKVHLLDPVAMTHLDALGMATINGAKGLGLENQVGSLEKDKKADIILVRTDVPEMVPRIDPTAHLAYSVTGSVVDASIVDGKILMMDREVKTMDEGKILSTAQEAALDLVSDTQTKFER